MEYKTWGDLLEHWSSSFVLITTATTGVRAETDTLIGVWYSVVHPKSEGCEQCMLLRQVPEDILKFGSEYHKVTPTMIRTSGKSDTEFSEELEKIKDKQILSYNPVFQSAFTGLYVHDLLKLKRIADTHMPVPADKTIPEIIKESSLKPRSAKQEFMEVKVCQDTLASFRVPAEASLFGLREIWFALCKTVVAVE